MRSCEVRKMNEVRLIDANALITELWKAMWKYEDEVEKQFLESDELDVGDWFSHRIFVQNMSDIDRDVVQNQPTVDAVPVRHGHWEIVPNDENRDDYYKMRCSVCGETLWSIQSEELYCCKCGAKMDECAGEERRSE